MPPVGNDTPNQHRPRAARGRDGDLTDVRYGNGVIVEENAEGDIRVVEGGGLARNEPQIEPQVGCGLRTGPYAGPKQQRPTRTRAHGADRRAESVQVSGPR